MAKKKIAVVAEGILEKKAAIKKLQQEVDRDMELIREHVEETGELEFGKAVAYERKNKPQFINVRKSVNVEKAIGALIDELSMDYKKYKIDVDLKKLLKEQATNKELKKLFKKHGLRLEQDASIHIKHF